jgi:hypothetical protein
LRNLDHMPAEKAVSYLRTGRSARLFIRGVVADHCPCRRFAVGADADAVALWDVLAGVAEISPHPPLTRDRVELMQIDTTASDNLPGFRVLGISPRSLKKNSKRRSSKAKEAISKLYQEARTS